VASQCFRKSIDSTFEGAQSSPNWHSSCCRTQPSERHASGFYIMISGNARLLGILSRAGVPSPHAGESPGLEKIEETLPAVA
jgi:hypothetical protein